MLYLTVMTPSLTRGENCENCENLSRLKINNLRQNCEKIVYLGSIFLNIVAVPVLPSPPSPVVYLKKPHPWVFVGNNIELEEADFLPQRRRFGNSFVA